MKIIKLEYSIKENEITLLKSLKKYLGINFVVGQKILRKKDIKVNNKKTGEDILLKRDDNIECFIPFNIDILYEDENILLVNKPKHIETVSSTFNNSLTHQLKQIYPYCEPCNRLDVNTTGINVFALNKESETEILKALFPKEFTLPELQSVYESILNITILYLIFANFILLIKKNLNIRNILILSLLLL